MSIVVVGGHSRSVGKTSMVAELIASMPEMHWTALKITQYGHGICSANGEPCDCVTDDHTSAVTQEHELSGESDTSRFLVAGAKSVYWVRTRQGMLAEAMPRIRKIVAEAENVIFESNSILKFLRPDLYLTILDFANSDFKDSAREYLDRADAIVVQNGQGQVPQWQGVSLKPVQGKVTFEVAPPPYCTQEIRSFVRERLSKPAVRA
jgi:hypothetical protein